MFSFQIHSHLTSWQQSLALQFIQCQQPYRLTWPPNITEQLFMENQLASLRSHVLFNANTEASLENHNNKSARCGMTFDPRAHHSMKQQETPSVWFHFCSEQRLTSLTKLSLTMSVYIFIFYDTTTHRHTRPAVSFPLSLPSCPQFVHRRCIFLLL